MISEGNDHIIKRLVDYQKNEIFDQKKKDKLILSLRNVFEDFIVEEDFIDEFFNFFDIVVRNDDEKFGVIFVDSTVLDQKTGFYKLQNKLMILSNSFKWNFIVINQDLEYSIQNVIEVIKKKIA